VTCTCGAEPQTVDHRVIRCHVDGYQVVVEMAMDGLSVRPAAVQCTVGWYHDLSERSALGGHMIEEHGVDTLVQRERLNCQPALVECTVDRYRSSSGRCSCVMHAIEEQEVDGLVPNELAHC
jgi:hypothetical protein